LLEKEMMEFQKKKTSILVLHSSEGDLNLVSTPGGWSHTPMGKKGIDHLGDTVHFCQSMQTLVDEELSGYTNAI